VRQAWQQAATDALPLALLDPFTSEGLTKVARPVQGRAWRRRPTRAALSLGREAPSLGFQSPDTKARRASAAPGGAQGGRADPGVGVAHALGRHPRGGRKAAVLLATRARAARETARARAMALPRVSRAGRSLCWESRCEVGCPEERGGAGGGSQALNLGKLGRTEELLRLAVSAMVRGHRYRAGKLQHPGSQMRKRLRLRLRGCNVETRITHGR